jgi:hypothetical protein
LTPIDIDAYKRPDYGHMSADEQRRYRFAFERQFNLLSNLCPKLVKIPPDIFTADLDDIHTRYFECWQQRLEISPFGKLRMGLMIFFLVVEFVGTKMLGLDFSGFTLRQIKKMTMYDPILIDIGRKYAKATGGEWSPETKLAFSAFVSAVCFVGASYVSRWIGPGSRDVLLNISDGVVGTVMPGTDAGAPDQESPELVPNNGNHNMVGNLLGSLMGMFTGGGSGNKANAGTSSAAGGPASTAAAGGREGESTARKPRAVVRIPRNGKQS